MGDTDREESVFGLELTRVFPIGPGFRCVSGVTYRIPARGVDAGVIGLWWDPCVNRVN